MAICAELDIPRPSGGYWNRLELGTAEEQVPLPHAPPGKPTEIPYGPRMATGETAPETSKPSAPSNRPENSEAVARDKEVPQSKSGIPDTDATGARLLPSDEPPLKEAAIVPEYVDYTRKQLYDAIWSKPCIKLAAELGISDVALAKTCRRMEILLPLRGLLGAGGGGRKAETRPIAGSQTGTKFPSYI